MENRDLEAAVLHLHRGVHVFSRRPELAAQLEERCVLLSLAPDQLVHAQAPADYLVRRGNLRVTQFLPDGREITRAVLQAGASFVVQAPGAAAPDARADRYPLPDIVLTALGETELWELPPGSVPQD